MTNILCLIPAKACSTRLARKNLLPLNGEPLVARVVRKAIISDIFDTICVSTEDEEVASVAASNGADVPFLRPAELSRDPATIVDVMLHALEFYRDRGKQFDRLCVLLPTSPFLTVENILEANQRFSSDVERAVMSVCETEYPPFNAWLVEETPTGAALSTCFPDSPYRYTKSTECPRTYRSNGAILIVGCKQLQETGTYRTEPIQPYIMSLENSLDIDTHFDYSFAKFLAETKSSETKSK